MGSRTRAILIMRFSIRRFRFINTCYIEDLTGRAYIANCRVKLFLRAIACRVVGHSKAADFEGGTYCPRCGVTHELV